MTKHLEPSCASCVYAQWDFERDEYDFDIGCRYPFFGDIREREDREEILMTFHGDFVTNAKECNSYFSIEQWQEKENNG